MKRNDSLKLTEKEKQYLERLERNSKIILINYITVGLSLCAALVGLGIAVKLKIEKGFLMAIVFGSLAFVLFMTTRVYQKHSRIISKLRRNIENQNIIG